MLKAVYKGGSSIILSKPNDEDYFYYYENNEERKKALIKDHEHNKDNHYKLWENRLNIFLGCYAYPFMEYISGEEIIEFKTFNICDHKAEYTEVVKKYTNSMKDTDKKWYHIYIACLMFEKGKNTITKEQKKQAQKIHDEGITTELKEWCLQILFTN